ncbi:MAG: hypothetical protein GF364_18020, partial [Candidatus Lokiarchaeota archaeon]|nr:hypothetical protein [Candidatus Lokiarchaeota archaeon]
MKKIESSEFIVFFTDRPVQSRKWEKMWAVISDPNQPDGIIAMLREDTLYFIDVKTLEILQEFTVSNPLGKSDYIYRIAKTGIEKVPIRTEDFDSVIDQGKKKLLWKEKVCKLEKLEGQKSTVLSFDGFTYEGPEFEIICARTAPSEWYNVVFPTGDDLSVEHFIFYNWHPAANLYAYHTYHRVGTTGFWEENNHWDKSRLITPMVYLSVVDQDIRNMWFLRIQKHLDKYGEVDWLDYLSDPDHGVLRYSKYPLKRDAEGNIVMATGSLFHERVGGFLEFARISEVFNLFEPYKKRRKEYSPKSDPCKPKQWDPKSSKTILNDVLSDCKSKDQNLPDLNPQDLMNILKDTNIKEIIKDYHDYQRQMRERHHRKFNADIFKGMTAIINAAFGTYRSKKLKKVVEHTDKFYFALLDQYITRVEDKNNIMHNHLSRSQKALRFFVFARKYAAYRDRFINHKVKTKTFRKHNINPNKY